MLRRFDKPRSSHPGMSAFAIMRREIDERTSAIIVEGDLDLSTAPRLKTMLLDALDGGHDRIVVDLSLVTFMDSTALGVLVGVNRRLDSSTRLAVVCTRPTVLQVFEFSGTDGAFAIHPTLEDALAYTGASTVDAGAHAADPGEHVIDMSAHAEDADRRAVEASGEAADTSGRAARAG